MAADLATLTVAAQPSRVGTCELCATDTVVLAAAAGVHHRRGGAIQLAACDRCARALHRLPAPPGAGAPGAARGAREPIAPGTPPPPPRRAAAGGPGPAP